MIEIESLISVVGQKWKAFNGLYYYYIVLIVQTFNGMYVQTFFLNYPLAFHSFSNKLSCLKQMLIH